MLGTDGRKMSKSRGNAHRAAGDRRRDGPRDPVARRPTRTGSITYDPSSRPEVANLLLLASLCTGVPPEVIADEIGPAARAALKALVTDALVEHLAPLRARRALFAAEPGLVADILAQGNARANELADATLRDVRELMGMAYCLSGVVTTSRCGPAPGRCPGTRHRPTGRRCTCRRTRRAA